MSRKQHNNAEYSHPSIRTASQLVGQHINGQQAGASRQRATGNWRLANWQPATPTQVATRRWPYSVQMLGSGPAVANQFFNTSCTSRSQILLHFRFYFPPGSLLARHVRRAQRLYSHPGDHSRVDDDVCMHFKFARLVR